jgi:hypothetical protein
VIFETSQDVKRNRCRLDRQVKHDEISGCRHQRKTNRGEYKKQVKLGLIADVFFSSGKNGSQSSTRQYKKAEYKSGAVEPQHFTPKEAWFISRTAEQSSYNENYYKTASGKPV